MDPNKYFSAYNLKSVGRKRKFGFAKNWEGVERESIKRKTRLSE